MGIFTKIFIWPLLCIQRVVLFTITYFGHSTTKNSLKYQIWNFAFWVDKMSQNRAIFFEIAPLILVLILSFCDSDPFCDFFYLSWFSLLFLILLLILILVILILLIMILFLFSDSCLMILFLFLILVNSDSSSDSCSDSCYCFLLFLFWFFWFLVLILLAWFFLLWSFWFWFLLRFLFLYFFYFFWFRRSNTFSIGG